MKNLKSNPESAPESASMSSRRSSRLFWRIFWLAFLVISLAYAWYCFYAPSNNVRWSQGYTEAQELSVQTDKPIILFFTATWCSPCRIMKRNVWADEQVATEVNERFIPVMLYADDPNATDVFNRYSVNGTPVTVITDSQGNVLDWVSGNVAKEDFLKFIRKPRP